MLGENAQSRLNSEYVSRLSRKTRRRPIRSATTDSTVAPTNMPRKPLPTTAALPIDPRANSLVRIGASTPPRNTS